MGDMQNFLTSKVLTISTWRHVIFSYCCEFCSEISAKFKYVFRQTMASVSFEDLLEHTGTIKAKSVTMKNNRGNKKPSNKSESKVKDEKLMIKAGTMRGISDDSVINKVKKEYEDGLNDETIKIKNKASSKCLTTNIFDNSDARKPKKNTKVRYANCCH